MARKKKSTKKVPCSDCGEPMAVDASAESGTCWKCANNMVSAKVKSRSRRTQKTGAAVAGVQPGATATKTERSGHMTPEAIRGRFDNPDPNRKAGFFQEVFNLIKTGTTNVEDVAKAASKLKSLPKRYTDIGQIEDQIRWYCKGVWGKRSGLVNIQGDEIEYTGAKED